jgi:diacylglycerol kinase family enzyme
MDAPTPRLAQALAGRVAAVINTASGGCDADAAATMQDLLDEAGLSATRVEAVGAEGIAATIEQAARAAEVLFILGGDGTIRTAVEACRSGRVLLAPLPGGTMNMLPRALYGDLAWPEVLRAILASPRVRPIGGGRAENRLFFVAALLGAPTLWADAREALRAGRLAEAARRAVTAARRSFSEPLGYAFGGVLTGSAEAVAVVCPLISKAMDEGDGRLEAAAIDTRTAADALRLGFHAVFDDWRADPAVVRTKVRWARVSAHGPVPVILDGEKVRMGRQVTLEYVPVAFRALVPAAVDTAAL